ncbi:MAG: phosphonate C-P lyase system protein PhnH [Deltaproteobacteria bacterium]|jgi:alpha-D-ribose 1-methylphosphonate 5-triphosphate synthase subunit PhnH|nr:phosphonate C-P lyase system protein PhnH [Deltaproteobacteria bacterium]
MMAIQPAFNDYTAASQTVFRAALTAMSRPATVREVDFEGLFKDTPPISVTLAALVMTLADHLTKVWLSKSLRGASDWLTFHLACPLADLDGDSDNTKIDAAIIVAANPQELPKFSALNRGTDRRPDTSATVMVAEALYSSSLKPNSELSRWAYGPGLEEPKLFSAPILTKDFLSDWEENFQAYPMGVDVFLTGQNLLAALPRSLNLSSQRPSL